MKKLKRWRAGILAAVLSVALMVPVMAYGRVETNRTGRLQLNYADTERENLPLSGMALRLYRVAEMTETVGFSATEPFRAAGVDLTGETDWAAKAGTLAAYAALHREALTPTASGSTDGSGSFAVEELPVGMYLVEGDSRTLGDYTYTPVPFLLTLPALDEETDHWLYEVSARGKFSRTYNGGGGDDGGDEDTISRSVRKVWAGDDESVRPTAVTVHLLKNGRVYDTVELSEENNWRHSWTELESGAGWQLAEAEIPENYTVLVEQSGKTFIVTNTYQQPSRETPPDEPPGETPGEGGTPPMETPPEKLPQTGVQWWPVQALTVSGLLLCFSGWRGSRKKGREDA